MQTMNLYRMYQITQYNKLFLHILLIYIIYIDFFFIYTHRINMGIIFVFYIVQQNKNKNTIQKKLFNDKVKVDNLVLDYLMANCISIHIYDSIYRRVYTCTTKIMFYNSFKRIILYSKVNYPLQYL